MKKILVPVSIGVLAAGAIVWNLIDQPTNYVPPDVFLHSNMEDVIALQQKADINCSKGEQPDLKKLDGKIIYNCNFSQSEPYTKVFPDDVSGVTLVCAQLDNVFLPPGVAVVDGDGGCGSHKQFKANPADKNNDWVVDAQGAFLQPLATEALPDPNTPNQCKTSC